MSGLAHVLEREGLSTVTLGLIPQHVRRMKPPRALLVPFELGRPLGAPNQPGLQTAVLQTALGLLDEAPPPPFIAEFETSIELEPQSEEDSDGWACPVALPAPTESPDPAARLLEEVRLLQPWYDRGHHDRGSTALGASGLEISEIVRWLNQLADGANAEPDQLAPESDLGLRLKLAVEDLKIFYLEAATSQPGSTSSAAAFDWFWDSTSAGALLRRLRDRLRDHQDPLVRIYAGATLVPNLRPKR